MESEKRKAPKRQLSVFDSVCIIVGIIVGAGIYQTPSIIAGCMPCWTSVLGIWLAGGLLALAGALCYAELATAYPGEGGDYIYLSRAYGGWAGYLFSWARLVIIRPASIAALAFIFGKYAQSLYAPFPNSQLAYAVAIVAVLTAINVLGVNEGKWTQNLLTVIKIAGFLGILVVALAAPDPQFGSSQGGTFSMGGLNLALILVLWTFGGWNEMAYVAAEIKRPDRNIVRALVIGTVAVTGLYVLINGAFLYVLGRESMASSQAVAVDTVKTVLPGMASRAIAALVCLSVLGAANGLIFTGARISYALGAEHSAFRGLGRWHGRFGTPVWALLVQGGLTSVIVLFAGSFKDTILHTAPVFWLFFLATGVSLFVLRRRRPELARPYKVSWYPVTPILFCGSCAFMIYSSVSYALATEPMSLILSSGVLLTGVIAYWLTDIRGLGQRPRNGAGPT